jgi:hypothetical protein
MLPLFVTILLLPSFLEADFMDWQHSDPESHELPYLIGLAPLEMGTTYRLSFFH